MSVAEKLRLIPKSPDILVPRGPFMRAWQIAEDPELFNREVSAKWVLRNLPGKVKLGHSTVGFYRDDVLAFIASRRAVA